MSNGNGPARSRRELRQARDAQAAPSGTPAADAPVSDAPVAPAADAPNVPDAPVSEASAAPVSPSPSQSPSPSPRSRRAAAGPVDAAPSPVRDAQPRDGETSERSSQIRARNREALRASKAAADAQSAGVSAEPEQAPTRRQRRLQQLETGRMSAVELPVDAVPPRRVDAPAHPVTSNLPVIPKAAPPAEPPRVEPAPPAEPAPSDSAAEPDLPQMTVEQALAARELLIGQAKNQVAMMKARQDQDPNSVDPVLLAQQRELAERAAILNRRAAAMQRIAEENAQRRPSQNDPTTAHNLAMITPLEFVNVPGMDRPVLKPPTTHVPVITSASPRVETGTAYGAVAKAVIPSPPAATPSVSAPADEPTANRALIAAGEAQPGLRRSRVLAQAERMAGARPAEAGEAVPVRAGQAYGLDPLDAETAGLGRMKRMLALQIATIGLGAAALIIGLLMIFSGLGR